VAPYVVVPDVENVGRVPTGAGSEVDVAEDDAHIVTTIVASECSPNERLDAIWLALPGSSRGTSTMSIQSHPLDTLLLAMPTKYQLTHVVVARRTSAQL
jgi:hypothetical protein